MASITFSSGTTITSVWLNDVNNLVWGVFNGATTPALARTALGVTPTGADTTYAFRANNLSDLANLTTARSNLGAAASGAVTASGITMNTARLLGRTTAGNGAIEEISIGTGLTLSAGSIMTTATGIPFFIVQFYPTF